MAVACIGAPSLQFGDPTATLDLDHAGGMFELVEVQLEFVVTQCEHVRGPEFIECRSKRAHLTNDDKQRAFAPQ
jgi:hypothetical protein